ncbi:MAG: hypothetical protein L6405_03055 [Actinomycetia bacterium]|nr:hypothetical protein [Actinomycetes bacterium]
MNQPGKHIFNISYIPVFVLLVFLILPSLVFSFSGCGLYYFDDEETSATKPDVEYMVIEVIDGDTLVLLNNEHVRLIGINTPESERYFTERQKKS